MESKKSLLPSLINQKCPKCRQGLMFEHSAFSRKFTDMHKKCQHCDLNFLQEPSFYFGAMYFSYAMQVVIILLVYGILKFTFNPEMWTYVLWMIIANVLMIPICFRLSRVMWIYLFIPFEKEAQQL